MKIPSTASTHQFGMRSALRSTQAVIAITTAIAAVATARADVSIMVQYATEASSTASLSAALS